MNSPTPIPTIAPEPIVYLVDDDSSVLDSLSKLIRSIAIRVITFDHPKVFLDHFRNEEVGCIILDIRMPGVSGIAVHEHLLAHGCALPVIFITGHGDVALCRKAFQNGALDFLTKPIDEQVMLDSLQMAIRTSVVSHQRRQKQQLIDAKFGRLTDREREVCALIVDGLANKQIATQLCLSLRTVENHRAAVFCKLEANSLAELVRMRLSVMESHHSSE